MKRLTYREIPGAIERREAFHGNSMHAERDPGWIDSGWLMGQDYRQLQNDRDFITYVVYSYGTPIAWERSDGMVYKVRQKFSRTSSRHQGTLYLMGGEPVPQEPQQFSTSYMDRAAFDLQNVVNEAQKELEGRDFDTLVATGLSGTLVVPMLALAMGKNFVIVRKESDDSHHGGGKLVGTLGDRWVFVDDFVSSGETRSQVIKKVRRAAANHGHQTTYVGDYLYTYEQGNRFRTDEAEAQAAA